MMSETKKIDGGSLSREFGWRTLLVLTPRFPYPLLSGDVIRIHQISSALAKDWKITLLTICQTVSEMSQPVPSDCPFSEIHRVYLPKWRSYLQALAALFSNEPIQIAYYRSGHYARLVNDLCVGKDALICHLLRMAPYASKFEGSKMLELTDQLPLTYERARSLKGSRRSLLSMVYGIEVSRIARAQARYGANFDLIGFVSDLDRNLFLAQTGLPSETVVAFPVSVDLRRRRFVEQRQGLNLAFIGNLRTLQNRDAVSYFVHEILVHIRKRHAHVELKIVGSIDQAFKKDVVSVPGVECLGVVESLNHALANCAIGVCPVRVAAGIQNKILDYMSLGLAVVTTPFGAEGMRAVEGEHLLIGESAVSFADRVIALLDDQNLRHRLARAARALVETEYAWEVNVKRLGSHFASLGSSASRGEETIVTDDARVSPSRQ
jgi:glycosyltransferase involved in cell wall biosynthesis